MTALLPPTRVAPATRVALVLLAASSTWIAEPAAARSAKDPKSPSSPSLALPRSVVDAARADACRRLDPRTGQLVPCSHRPGSGPSSGGGDGGGATADELPRPFALFEPYQDEADFDDHPESVLVNAYLLSQLAALSYEEPGPDGPAYAMAEELGLLSLPVIERHHASFLDLHGPGGNTRAYVFFDERAVFVAFEGSTVSPSVADWQDTNLDIVPHYKPEWGEDEKMVCAPVVGCVTLVTDVVTLHHGFYDAMDLVFLEVLEAIEPLLENRRLWITGHSLGGAVAQLTAFRLQFEKGIPVQGVHVFGAPAVGDGLWAEVFDAEMSNVHRWSLEGDPAHVLTQAPMFFHVGITNNLYTNGALVLDDDHFFGYVPNCGVLYGINVVHMHYWPRMREELEESRPDLAAQLPESLPGLSDGNDFCHLPGGSV